jgi:hypothetical protein
MKLIRLNTFWPWFSLWILLVALTDQATAVTTTIITLRGQISGFDARDPLEAQIDPGLLAAGDQFVVTISFHSDRFRSFSTDPSPLDPSGKILAG